MSSESPTNKNKATPVLYHRLYCSSSPILQALMELGIKDDKVAIKTITAEEQKEEAYLKLNPSGQVPVFVDSQGKTVAESIAIMLNVLDEFDTEHKLMPATGDNRRYLCIEAMCFAATSLYPTLISLGSESEDTKTEARKVAEKLTIAVEALLKRIDGPYILGDQLSAADFFLAYDLFGMKYMKDGGPIMMTDSITAYLDTLEKLPSTREVYALDSEEHVAAAADAKMEETEKPVDTAEIKPVAAEEAAADSKSMEVVTVSKDKEAAVDAKGFAESVPADEVVAAGTTA